MAFNPVGILIGFGASLFSSFFGGRSAKIPPIKIKLTPRVPQVAQSVDEYQSSLSYGYDGPQNSLSEGLPLPIIYGAIRVGGQIVNYYVDVTENTEYVYVQLAVCGHAVTSMPYNTDNEIWVNDNIKLSNIENAEYDYRLGSSTQTPMTWFGSMHKVRTVEQPVQESVKELITFDSSFYDVSIYNRTVTPSSLVALTTIAACGTYAAQFAPSTGHINKYYIALTNGTSWQNAPYSLGSGDFTVEMWLRATQMMGGGYRCPFKWENEVDGSGYFFLILPSSQHIYMYFIDSSDGSYAASTHTIVKSLRTSWSTSAWHHIALVRNGSQFYFFFDGDDRTDTANTIRWTSPVITPSACLGTYPKLGGAPSTYLMSLAEDWVGQIDQFRFSRKAQYVTTFTPTTDMFGTTGSPIIVPYDSTYVDKISFTLDFPRGLYSMTYSTASTGLELVEKSVDYQVRVQRHTWGSLYFYLSTLHTAKASRQSLYRQKFDCDFTYVNISTISGSFSRGETIIGATSSASGVITIPYGSTRLYLTDISGTFSTGETITGDTSSAVATLNSGPTPDRAGWTIYLTRKTEDDYNGVDVSEMQVGLIDEQLRVALAYPSVSLLGLKIPYTNKIGSSVSNVSVVVYREYVTIPRWAVDGGGTMTVSADVPAYIMLDILCNYAGVDIEKIDRDSIMAWAIYTETVVSSVKRASFNGIFDTLGSVHDALLRVLKIGRANLIIGDKFKVVIDQPVATTSYSGLYTAGNIVTDSYQFSYISRNDLPKAISVEYLDAAENYRRKTYTYRGATYDVTSDPISVQPDFLVGCTNAAQATRYAILTYQLLTMPRARCAFETGIEGLDCEPGDVIWVQPLYSSSTYGGRVVTSTGNTVTLDQSVYLDSAKYTNCAKIWVRHADGTIEMRTISATEFDSWQTRLTVTSAWTQNPEAGDVYGIGRYVTNYNTVDIWAWRVLGISRGEAGRIKIECIEYVHQAYYHPDYGGGATII